MPLPRLLMLNLVVWSVASYSALSAWRLPATNGTGFRNLQVPALVRAVLLPKDLIDFWLVLNAVLAIPATPAAFIAAAALGFSLITPEQRRMQAQNEYCSHAE